MADIDELLRLRDATATPALEQLCWYDVKPEQASFFEAALEDVPELVRELSLAREDVQAASGELLVEMPRPGTDMARVMLANSAMRRERDQLDEDYRKLFAVKAELGAEVERLKAIAKGNGDDSLHFARKADDIATQLRELCEAAERLTDHIDRKYVDLNHPSDFAMRHHETLHERAVKLRAVLAKVPTP